LEVLDPSGRSLGKLGEPGRILDLRISPDAKSVAFSLVDPNTGKVDIWTQDLSTGNRTRITRDPRAANAPTWSPDSTALFYQSTRVQNKPSIVVLPTNGMGVEQKVWEPVREGWPDDVTKDSKALVVEDRAEDGITRVSLVPLDRTVRPPPV
jgi:Tol biopolymer transport system component